MQAQVKRMNEVGDTVFLTPTPLLSYEKLVLKSLTLMKKSFPLRSVSEPPPS